jgi:predicted ArsR family transcriptional regulator
MKISMRRRWTYDEEMLIERIYMQPSFWGCGKWDDLAEKMGVTAKQMKNHVDYLVKKGVLKKKSRKKSEKRVNTNWWTDKEKMELDVIMRTYKKGIWIKKAMLRLGKTQRSIYYMSRKLKLGM